MGRRNVGAAASLCACFLGSALFVKDGEAFLAASSSLGRQQPGHPAALQERNLHCIRVRPSIGRAQMSAVDTASLGLTPELDRLVRAFRAMPDDKMRYKQLLFMAAQGANMDPSLQTQENKVQGCLSTVFVHATVRDGLVQFEGDSDAQLTKGLVSILVRGLSGCSPQDIQRVKPEFIQATGLQTSLTPGRNNGFINMLATMKRKALEAEAAAAASAPAAAEAGEGVAAATAGAESDADAGAAAGATGTTAASTGAAVDGKPVTAALLQKLKALNPMRLEVEDESGNEQKFYIAIVAEGFAGLPLLKRHQMVYALIAEEMAVVHAVSLSTKTPAEVGM